MALALGALPWPTTTGVGRVVSNVVHQNITRRWTQTFSLSDEPPSTAAIRRHPYPSAAPDHSLFEDDDYELSAVAGPSTLTTPTRSRKLVSESLLSRLIQQRDFTEAERVRDELLAASDSTLTERTSHALISRAIRYTLHHTPSSSARLESFTRWLNFLPVNSHLKGKPFLTYARNTLCVPPPPGTYADLSYITAYCHAAIKKHWGTAAMKEMIPFVAQYAEPRDMMRFFEEMQTAYTEYNKTKTSIVRTHTTQWWIYGVRCAFRADRNDEALALLQAALVNRTLNTSQWVQCLETIRDPSVLGTGLALAEQHDQDIPALQTQLAQLSKSVDPLSSAQPLPSLATHILHLLRHSSNKDLIHLRKKYCGADPTTFASSSLATHFLHALMLAHARNKEWQALLDVFTYHFHSSCVPTSHVRTFSSLDDGRARPPYFSPTTPQTRLTPTRGITALTWSALVHLNAENRDTIQELYNALLHSTTLEHKAGVQPQKRHFDEAHFAPFARWAIRIPTPVPRAGLGIVDDMQALGVSAGMHVHASIVAAHARRGLPGAAQQYIEELEKAADAEEVKGEEGRKNVRPTPETYALAIRIMMGPRPEEALELVDRMKEKFGGVKTMDGCSAEDLRAKVLSRHSNFGLHATEPDLLEPEAEQYVESVAEISEPSRSPSEVWVDPPTGKEKAVMPILWRMKLAEPASQKLAMAKKDKEEKEKSVFLVPPLLGSRRT